MQIPPLKKSTFYIIVIAVLLIGTILGVVSTSYYLYLNRDKLSALGQQGRINTDLPQQLIEKAAALIPGRTIFGKVLSKEANRFSIEITVQNPLDAKNSTTTKVNVPFDAQKDEVMLLKPVPGEPTTIQPVVSSFGDIKIGQQIYVKVSQDKKTVYLLPAQ